MPKERESELRHLGGKAFQPLHSSCMKKMPTSRQKEASEFDVLSDLRNLSNKADQLAEKKLPEDNGLEEWFEAVRKTMENIRDCNSVKDIKYPSSIVTFFDTKNKDEKLVSPVIERTPILKVNVSVSKITPGNETVALDTQMVTPSTSVRKKVDPFVLLNQLTTEEINLHSNGNSNEKDNRKPVMQTPLLNRTYDKINETVVTDSGSARDKYRTPNAANSNGDIITTSGKKKENMCPNSHGMVTRSGSKRKSSGTRNKSNKKQKVDSHNTSSATLNKTTQLRHPLRDLKASVLASENRSKLSSVVKPPVLPKQSVVAKEQHKLEEIKKKEKKREENLQKIMAERQLKAQQNKKTREEKRTKTMQKRLQLEKEKEEKREKEAKKSQAKVNKENPKKTTRAKELVEQHVKESKSSIITSTTQSTSSTSSAEAIVKTPAQANRKSDDIESYELTPVPDSSTYNFSDDEDERPTRKPIPSWAQGVLLKSALMQQYYYPVNTEEIFGSIIETPNLAEIFKVSKKRYFKRTSSAVWNTPPDRSYHL